MVLGLLKVRFLRARLFECGGCSGSVLIWEGCVLVGLMEVEALAGVFVTQKEILGWFICLV